MPDIHIEEASVDNIDLIEKYFEEQKSFNSNFKPWVTKETLPAYLKELENNKNGKGNKKYSSRKYFLIVNNRIVGHGSIRYNITDYEMNEFGGNIGYGILPLERKKGYASIFCHLMIEKLHELGLQNIMISCNEENIASSKVIENNGGILRKMKVVNYPACLFYGKVEKIYDIDTENSIKNFPNFKKSNIEVLLNELNKLDRTNLNDFLIIDYQHTVGPSLGKTIGELPEINNVNDIEYLYKYMLLNFHPDKNHEYPKFKRTSEEIATSKVITGCIDAATLIAPILKSKGIPTIVVQSANIEWVKELQNSKEVPLIHGHVFLEIFLNNNWYLFDPMNGKIYENYDYNNLSLPDNYYAFDKSLSTFSSGTIGPNASKINANRMVNIFKDFDTNCYKKPNCNQINFNEQSKTL